MKFPPRVHAGFTIGALALLTMTAAVVPGHAADVANGRKVAAGKCALCHGLDGQAKVPEAPNLSGQVEQYIAKQLNAFRDKSRTNDQMSLVAPTLTEKDVADLAAFYSAIEVKIGKVPGE